MATGFFKDLIPNESSNSHLLSQSEKATSGGYKGTRYVSRENANALTNSRYKKTDWSYLNAAPTPLVEESFFGTQFENLVQPETEVKKKSFGEIVGGAAKALALSVPKGLWDFVGNAFEYYAVHNMSNGFNASDAFLFSNIGKDADKTPEQKQQQRVLSYAPIGQFQDKASDYLAKEIDMEHQPGWVQFTGGLIESTPYTLASLLPAGSGMILNYGAMYTASYNQKLAEKKASGLPVTQEDIDNIETYAAGAALVEAVSEQIFPLGKRAFGKASAKATAQVLKTLPMKSAIKYVLKYFALNGLEEGAEEIISEIGQGTVAKFTTDKDAPWWDESDPNSILTAKSVGLAGLGGFIMGSTLTMFNSKSVYNDFTNSKKMYEEVKDMPLDALTADIQARGKEAVMKDLLSKPNRDVAINETKTTIAQADEVSPIDAQIERYQNALVNLDNNVSSATTPEKQAIYKEAKLRAKNSLIAAEKMKAEMKRVGSKYTPQQIESMLTNSKNSIEQSTAALRTTTVDDVRSVLQEDISYHEAKIKELEMYKSKFAPDFNGKDISMETKKQARGLPKAVKKTRAYEYGAFETAPSQYTIMRKSLTKPSGGWQALPNSDIRNKSYPSIEEATRALYAPSIPAKVAAMEEQGAEPAAAKERMTYEQAQFEQSKALSKESMKANPPSGIEHIVSPESRGLFDMSQSEQNREDFAYKKTQSEETIRRIEEASTPAKDPRLFKNKVKEFFDNSEYRAEVINRAKEVLTFGSVPLNRKYGDILRTWRTLRKSNGLASAEALKIVETIYKQVPKEKVELFNSAIIYADMVEDIKHKTFTPGRFGIESSGEALSTYAAIQEDLKKPENAMLVDLMKVRKEQMDKVRDELISLAAEAGLDFSYIKDYRVEYVYHAILEFTSEFTGVDTEEFKKKAFIGYEKRKGSEKDYVANPFYADWMILFNMSKNMYHLDLYRAIKKQDVSKTYGKDRHGNYIVPEGYGLLDPSCFRIKEFDEQSVKNMTSKAYAQIVKEKVSANSARGREILETWAKKANRVTLVVPIDIVRAVNKEFSRKANNIEANAVSKTLLWLTRKWKYVQIRFPHRVIKYNLRNMSGDADFVFAGNTKVLNPKTLFPAIGELWDYFKNKSITNPLMHEYIRRFGLTTSQPNVELGKLMDVAGVKFESEKNITKAVKFIWKEVLTLEAATEFREQVLRYAAFKTWVTEMQGTKNGLPTNYGASYKEEIDSIENIYDRAVKLSNDLLGAYDDVGAVGSYLSDHIFPFLRFRALNFKRYIKIYENAMFNNGKNETINQTKLALNKVGGVGRVSGVAAFRIAKLTAKIAAANFVYQILNSLFARDEEDELPEYVKETPHVTIPRALTRWTGSDKIYYIAGLGSFQDLMNMFGLDMTSASDLKRVANGDITFADWASETAKESALDWINSSFPLGKLFLGYALGVDYYPDASNPRDIRDKMEFTMKQVGLDNEWRALMGMPITSGSIFTEQMDRVLNSVLPGDAAVYDVNEMIEDFMIENNYSYKPYESSKDVSPDSLEANRASAAYNYKLAIKLGDKNAAEKYLIEYAYYGGTSKGIATSIRSSLVYTKLSPEEKEQFKASLTPDEMVTLERYFEYAEWLTDEAIEGLKGQN